MSVQSAVFAQFTYCVKFIEKNYDIGTKNITGNLNVSSGHVRNQAGAQNCTQNLINSAPVSRPLARSGIFVKQ